MRKRKIDTIEDAIAALQESLETKQLLSGYTFHAIVWWKVAPALSKQELGWLQLYETLLTQYENEKDSFSEEN